MNTIESIELPSILKSGVSFVLRIHYSLSHPRSASIDVGDSADVFNIFPSEVRLERAPSGGVSELSCTIERKNPARKGTRHCYVRVCMGDSIREKHIEVE